MDENVTHTNSTRGNGPLPGDSGRAWTFLPADVWHLIVDAVAAQEAHRGRWRDLARLGWTCKAAYKAAHPVLWRNLTLVFRSFKAIERQSQLEDDANAGVGSDDKLWLGWWRSDGPSLDDQYIHQGLVERHQRVVESCVFPCYRRPVSNPLLAQRIRQVSLGHYSFFYPFVVLDGRLYLASLVEHEASHDGNNNADLVDRVARGVEALWTRPVTDIRIQGGLVLVPFPLELVSEVTINDLDKDLNFDVSDEPPAHELITGPLRFLTDIPGSKVHTFRFYSNSGQSTFALYYPLTKHLDHVRHYDWALVNGRLSTARITVLVSATTRARSMS